MVVGYFIAMKLGREEGVTARELGWAAIFREGTGMAAIFFAREPGWAAIFWR